VPDRFVGWAVGTLRPHRPSVGPVRIILGGALHDKHITERRNRPGRYSPGAVGVSVGEFPRAQNPDMPAVGWFALPAAGALSEGQVK
jgi:hypothetical protein